MCDKLQTSKDGSVDLCHSRLVEYSAHHRSSNYTINGSNNSRISSSSSSSSRKQRKYYGKDSSSRGTDSDKSRGLYKERGYGPHRERLGENQGQQRPSNKDSRQKTESTSSDGVGGIVSNREGPESGKKKSPPTSLNHLLNFTVASAERYSSGRRVIPHPIVRSRKRNTSHSYNKEEFLQANCQFVVSASRDYSIHTEDPDKLVDWECIQQVRLFCHEIPSCPICLYPPRAAKITRCGHVYCWSCLLHYLSLGKKKWSKCPICNESIYKDDVKSVTALSSPQYKVGDAISMKLMVREKGSTQVFASTDWDGKQHPMLTVEDSCVNQFVKLVSATPFQVLSVIIGPERRALQEQLAQLGTDEASEKCFIEVALKDLEERESELVKTNTILSQVEKKMVITDSYSAPQPLQCSPASTTWTAFSDQYFEGGFEHPFLELSGGDQDIYSSGQSQTVDGEGACGPSTEEETVPSDQPPSGTMGIKEGSKERENSVESSPNSLGSPRSFTSEGSNDGIQAHKGDLVYFYQASDGQHFYMHPVNIRCLSKEYGGLEYCPCEISATVVEMEQLTMSEETRGRYKSLSHLPLTCELALCELDLKPPIVSPDTLEQFSTELQRRRQKRVKKRKDERRREKRAEARNSYTEPSYRVPSALELTPEKFHDFLSLTSSPSLSDSGSPGAAIKSDHPLEVKDEGASSSMDTPPPPSFAQALQCKSSVKVSPKGMLPTGTPIPQIGEEEETAVPSFQDAFNEAFQTASMSINKAPGGKPGSKTAKKGRKKLVLFSTGGSRGYN